MASRVVGSSPRARSGAWKGVAGTASRGDVGEDEMATMSRNHQRKRALWGCTEMYAKGKKSRRGRRREGEERYIAAGVMTDVRMCAWEMER